MTRIILSSWAACGLAGSLIALSPLDPVSGTLLSIIVGVGIGLVAVKMVTK